MRSLVCASARYERFRLGRVATLLFFSGASALVCQTAWFRELRLVFGASTLASAVVLAVFMGGLGLGSALLGKRADRAANPLRFYGNLELAVSITAALTPFLVRLAAKIYLGLGGSAALGPVGATFLRLALTVVVLGPPAILMGGTLPAAARAVTQAGDARRRRVAILYGVNTAGAVAGALASTFFLIEALGNRKTIWLACLANAAVAIVARSSSRRPVDAIESEWAQLEPFDPDAAGAPGAARAAAPSTVAAAAAITGAAFMLMELVWYRMLAPVLGGSSYTFGLVLAMALSGVGLGGAIYAKVRIRPTLAAFAVTCALEALALLVPYALGDRIAILALLLRPLCADSFLATSLAWTFIASVVVVPAAIVSGIQFPLVIGLCGTGEEAVGRDVGAVYLANTMGAIVGSIAGGFGLLPLLSAQGCWRLVASVLGATALVATVLDVRRRGRSAIRARSARFVALALLAGGACLLTTGPTAVWRHSGIGAGRGDRALGTASSSEIESFVRFHRSGVAWDADGVESGVALVQNTGFAFIVNGKADGHSLKDSPTQVMSGVLGAMLHPEPRRALVIGLGTGETAGWLGALPTIDRVDVVELEPAILRVARDCAAANRQVLDNPKVRIALGDGREALLTTRERYDIIFSEPSNPYRAGIASFYTEEFFRAASRRLNPGGRYIHWIQAYEVDVWTIATTMVTLSRVFENVSVWNTTGGDLLLVAQDTPAVIDVEDLRRRISLPDYAAALHGTWLTDSVEGVLAHHMASPELARSLARRKLGAVNHDDDNVLEFAFARGLGHHKVVSGDIVELAREAGSGAPALSGEIVEARIAEERWLWQTARDRPLDPRPDSVPEPARAFGRMLQAWSEHRYADVLVTSREQHRSRSSYFEASILADAAVRAGDAEAERFIDAVGNEGERELLHGLRWDRLKEPARAIASLEHGFTIMRRDPWVWQITGSAALDLAAELSARGDDHDRRLFAALATPFAAEMHREQRITTRAMIASTFDPKACAEVLHSLEPPPLVPRLIELRARCYRAAGDPLARSAEIDHERLRDRGR